MYLLSLQDGDILAGHPICTIIRLICTFCLNNHVKALGSPVSP